MLKAINIYLSSFLGQLIIGLLLLSFPIWGLVISINNFFGNFLYGEFDSGLEILIELFSIIFCMVVFSYAVYWLHDLYVEWHYRIQRVITDLDYKTRIDIFHIWKSNNYPELLDEFAIKHYPYKIGYHENKPNPPISNYERYYDNGVVKIRERGGGR